MQKQPLFRRAFTTYTAQNPKITGWVPCMAFSRAAYSTRSVSTNEPVVSVDWLYDNLKDPDVKVLAESPLLLTWWCPYRVFNLYDCNFVVAAFFFLFCLFIFCMCISAHSTNVERVETENKANVLQ